MTGFLIFCLLSGAVYIINDLADLEADRQHPTKRNRPLASGSLPVSVARIAVVLILIISFPVAFILSPAFFAVALTYFLLNLGYSFRLKHVPLLDVMVLASFYVLRVAAGVFGMAERSERLDVERGHGLLVATNLLAHRVPPGVWLRPSLPADRPRVRPLGILPPSAKPAWR